jgi:hypothetical protein
LCDFWKELIILDTFLFITLVISHVIRHKDLK